MYPPVLSPKLQQIRSQINTLTPQERQALLQTLLADPLPAPPTTSETAEEAPVVRVFVPITPTPLDPALLTRAAPVRDIADLAADWDTGPETADEINEFIRRMRQADLVLEQERAKERGDLFS
jgi:hypothetical protein